MTDNPRVFRPDAEEDFAKEFPTRDQNPDNLIFLQGYEGEMYRELVFAASESIDDSEKALLWVDQEESLSPDEKEHLSDNSEGRQVLRKKI